VIPINLGVMPVNLGTQIPDIDADRQTASRQRVNLETCHPYPETPGDVCERILVRDPGMDSERQSGEMLKRTETPRVMNIKINPVDIRAIQRQGINTPRSILLVPAKESKGCIWNVHRILESDKDPLLDEFFPGMWRNCEPHPGQHVTVFPQVPNDGCQKPVGRGDVVPGDLERDLVATSVLDDIIAGLLELFNDDAFGCILFFRAVSPVQSGCEHCPGMDLMDSQNDKTDQEQDSHCTSLAE